MQVKARIAAALRAAKQTWGPPKIKRKVWDEEYASGKWDHCDHTPGAWVYGFIQKYCRNGSILDLGCGAGNTGNELDVTSYRQYIGVDVSEVAVQKAGKRSAREGRAAKNRFVQGDILSYIPEEKHNVILLRESVYHIPRTKVKPTLDRYSRYFTDDGVFVVYLSRDGTKKVKEIVRWIEMNYHVIEKHWREHPAPDAAAYHGDAFVLIFR
jgi:SAM-dependent methyltransferase